ncbi:porin [Celeribacter marinus]|uniref:Porin n=1 Tax=Celeribacter marinus TaxID=1397108 RepID=A0A0N9ZZQ6_9RHOB|nr:porin [Celeribacter marinus]ALI55860.1 porin [Celeribacter marinus]SFK89688.1 porin [Celeribacter marinus]
MKNILLSTTAVVAFAGAAAAEVSFNGDAKLGYNNDVEDGFYWEAGLTAKMAQELDNGITVAASLDIDLTRDSAQSLGAVTTSDFVVTISSETASLSFGDVATAASTFAFANDMDGGIKDHVEDYADGNDNGLLVKASFGDFSIAASTIIDDAAAATGENGATQVAVAGSFGGINVGLLSVQDETNASIAQDDAMLVSLGGTFAGVDATLNAGNVNNVDRMGLDLGYALGDVVLGAYYMNSDATGAKDMYGVKATYTAGAVTVKGYYTDNRGNVDGDNEYSVAVAYDMGNGLVINAGIIDGETAGSTDDDQYNYIVADYNLGGGASFLVSYADANGDATANSNDIDTTLGGYELKSGVTAQLKLAF